jgi:hypothetical protein
MENFIFDSKRLLLFPFVGDSEGFQLTAAQTRRRRRDANDGRIKSLAPRKFPRFALSASDTHKRRQIAKTRGPFIAA